MLDKLIEYMEGGDIKPEDIDKDRVAEIEMCVALWKYLQSLERELPIRESAYEAVADHHKKYKKKVKTDKWGDEKVIQPIDEKTGKAMTSDLWLALRAWTVYTKQLVDTGEGYREIETETRIPVFDFGIIPERHMICGLKLSSSFEEYYFEKYGKMPFVFTDFYDEMASIAIESFPALAKTKSEHISNNLQDLSRAARATGVSKEDLQKLGEQLCEIVRKMQGLMSTSNRLDYGSRLFREKYWVGSSLHRNCKELELARGYILIACKVLEDTIKQFPQLEDENLEVQIRSIGIEIEDFAKNNPAIQRTHKYSIIPF